MSTPQPLEPFGRDNALPAAGIVAACAGSLRPDPEWLRAYLTRVLGSPPGLDLRPGARDAIIEQSLEISQSSNPVTTGIDVLDRYLSAANFESGQAVPLVASLLHADVLNATAYDARARETLMRLVSALHLPPRILYQAETHLAVLVTTVNSNSKGDNGENVEAVAEDPDEERRRKTVKWIKIGTAGVLSGIALGISGGLIAPALLPALGTVSLAGASVPFATLGTTGVAAVTGLFGAAGAGVGAAAMSSRTGGVDEFVFEPCNVLDDGTKRASVYEEASVTPAQKIHEVFVPLSDDDDKSVIGGLLVWEVLTYQEDAIIVPGAIGLTIQYQKFAKDGEKSPAPEDLLPEDVMDAGGLEKSGRKKRRRTTGAVTVLGAGLYILRFRLHPGSLAVNISYRVALVPPGKDPPLWLMEENEYEPSIQVKVDMRSLSTAILVPGLIRSDVHNLYPGICADQFATTAAALGKFDIQTFALRWDSSLLLELSTAMRKLIGKMAFSMAAQRGAMMVVPAVVGAVALPVSVIGAVRTLIGNIWAKAISHANDCGYMLAAELASRSLGNRPVVLAGCSVGAAVVFSCLQELSRRNLTGIVHDAYLVGAPCTTDVTVWREIRSVVSGRLVNAYMPKDWYLNLYSKSTTFTAVAGTRPIQDLDGIANVENICLTEEQITTHTDYADRGSAILLDLGIGDQEKRRPWFQTSDDNAVLAIAGSSSVEKTDEIEKFDKLDIGELTKEDDVELFTAVKKRKSLIATFREKRRESKSRK